MYVLDPLVGNSQFSILRHALDSESAEGSGDQEEGQGRASREGI